MTKEYITKLNEVNQAVDGLETQIIVIQNLNITGLIHALHTLKARLSALETLIK